MVDARPEPGAAAPISVLIVDDQALIRSAVSQIVGHEPGFVIAGEATNGREAIELAAGLRPDVVLMDIRMPVIDGLAATRAICTDPALAAVKVLILTTFEEDEYVVQALRAGASGFIGKGTEPADLIRALRTVYQGDALLSPAATKSLIDRYVRPIRAPGVGQGRAGPAGGGQAGAGQAGAGRGGAGQSGGADGWGAAAGGGGGASAVPVPPELTELTEREREILLLVALGLSNDDIAAKLVISPLTAKTHVNRTMSKLEAHDRAQLVIIAYESGLVHPGDAR